MKNELIVMLDNKYIERRELNKTTMKIGRIKGNDIMLQQNGISRFHAEITVCCDGVVIKDNCSLNGIFLNDRKIKEATLQNGDVLNIGRYALIFIRTPRKATLTVEDGES